MNVPSVGKNHDSDSPFATSELHANAAYQDSSTFRPPRVEVSTSETRSQTRLRSFRTNDEVA
ncbi:MAG: hypothetical protein DWQ31_14770 [Planctomycetota bacterium]|nr:MAG: hypothetical protein DWQ31_14770 [Planctomycetota bacterium]REJ90786.1 MAG: hypothetical protein DWQ35_15725 [Planctomycetota bacterium]REK23890.1 MAG: hypothetical protein DWQ42_14210 [Planctomycetota bacterium]